MNTSYDAVAYQGFAYPDTHPRSLGAIGRLFGLDCARPSSCRVLEIGCGDGVNLLSMACSLPESRFTGIDLSASAIAKASRTVASLRLANVRLIQADLLAVDPDALGAFDYIIAHGFYSWVPSDVRDGLMKTLARCLAPSGIAFVSYNAQPGFHLREMLRSILMLHTRSARSPSEKISRARALCEYLAIGSDEEGAERRVLRSEAERLLRKPDGVLFHDDLAEINTPVWFHDFAAHAGRYGLAFLADAGAAAVPSRGLPEDVVSMLDTLDRPTREQYRDFFLCRRYRESLLVRQDASVTPGASLSALDSLFLAAPAPIAEKKKCPKKEVLYRYQSGAQVKTGERGVIALVDLLLKAWPDAVCFESAFSVVKPWLPPEMSELQRHDAMARALLDLHALGSMTIVTEVPKAALRPGALPRASRFAREQIKTGSMVTNLWHDSVSIDDPFAARLLPLLDGTRSRQQLALEMKGHQLPPAQKLPESLERHLGHLARLALLEL